MRMSLLRVASLVALMVMTAVSSARAQGPAEEGRFTTGPLVWTPTFQIHDAGVDSNVFNTPTGARDDVTASAKSEVDSVLKLGAFRASSVGALEYNYFQTYKSQRGFNRRVATHLESPEARFSPDVTVSWARLKERSGNEIDVRAPRTDLAYAGGVQARLTSRLSILATAGRQNSTYDTGLTFHDIELARQLNHESTIGTLTTRIVLTPLTSLSIDAIASHDSFPFRPAAATDSGRIDARLGFAPDAVIRGGASVGYHSMQPYYRRAPNTAAAAFSGITSSVDLSYTLLSVTKFAARFSRDSNYSIYTDQPYYLSTVGGLQILQSLFGPVELEIHTTLESLDYPQTETEPAHVDTADSVGGGLTIQLAPQTALSLLYDTSERRSPRGREYEYQRRRIYTTITYGF
jgi:hypothetical protein